MRLCRFEAPGHAGSRLGFIRGNTIRDVTTAVDILPCYRYPFPAGDSLITHLEPLTTRIQEIAAESPELSLDRVKLLSPVANPGKIIAAPVNYQKHLAEVHADSALHQNNPSHTITIQKAGLFLKASSSLVGPGEGIALRMPDRRTDHEVELAFVIRKQASNISRENAISYIAGYAICLDVTIRGTEDRSFRKSVDSYTVLGPWLVTADEVADPGHLDLSITVNGETRQSSNTRHMILGVPELIELASSFYTLCPGDIISTGTPEGVSPIVPGDRIVATIEGIGSMEVAVRAA
jgi:2-keto-4-pentenoate hydratase/2-oxohepta-3-ene-1,7-dioic acid hydratase in catechol pathway